MPYIPRISFKTGINPSMVRNFAVDGNYTGTQKLMLTATRIFGTKIGGPLRSGVSPFRGNRTSRNFLVPWRADPNEMHRYWPSMMEHEEMEFKRIQLIKWKDEREKRLARRKKK